MHITGPHESAKRLAGFLRAASCLLVLSCGVAPASDLESRFARLEALSIRIGQKGADSKSNIELRQIRDFFVLGKDEAGVFLIDKLRVMNEEERRFLAGSADPLMGVAYVQNLREHGKTTLTKYYVCAILADAFPRLSPPVQGQVLESISASYTPSSYGQEDMQALHFALLRIGPQAVPQLLRLAASCSEPVRCGVMRVLNSIAEDAQKAVSSEALRVPPNLDCKGKLENRSQALERWTVWWNDVGRKAPFSEIPSFFEM